MDRLHKKLQREIKREALTRLENSARTLADFENVATEWDKIDESRERNERRNEMMFSQISTTHSDTKLSEESKLDIMIYKSHKVHPPPINHRLWRQLMSGDFLETIFDCPYEIDELVSSKGVSKILKSLNDNQKEVLYFRLVRNWSPQRIAAVRGQTDRNIRKVYETAIKSIRRKLGVKEE